jgi:transcriptional regulator with GAF, ATPase, and Fis domain
VGPTDLGTSHTTLSIGAESVPTRARAVPGAVLIFAGHKPAARVYRAGSGALELGRQELAVGTGTDALISRRHVHLRFDGVGWLVEDLGSRNGTFVDGRPVTPSTEAPAGTLVRVGGALLLLVSDVVPFEHYVTGMRDGVVAGPALRRALESVGRAAQTAAAGASLLILGETGAGKELAARAFHAASGRPDAPFIIVNCATIPRELGERLLFGARRGAYSGATDATGYIQAAHGGTLCLDEVAELSLEVQSKLLRVIETREVLRLGATRHEHVDIRLCAATWRDLRAEVVAGRFREDLYFRIGQPEVRLPPLRERREEIPWHVEQVLAQLDGVGERQLSVAASYVEACAARPWPGNVRELRGEVRRAVLAATDVPSVLDAECLGESAGRALFSAGTPVPAQAEARASALGFPEDAIAAAMATAAGNVAGAARQLGVHRNKVRRWLERHGVEPRQFKVPRKARS